MLWHEVRGESCVQAASNLPVSTLWVQLDELAIGEFGVQNPPAPAMKKAIRVSEWLFSVKFVPTERVKYANACEIACGSEIRLRRVEERILFHIDQSRRRREIFHNF